MVEDDEGTRWRVVEDALGVPRPSPPSPRFAVDIGRGGLLSNSSHDSRAAAVELQSGFSAVSWRVASGLWQQQHCCSPREAILRAQGRAKFAQ